MSCGIRETDRGRILRVLPPDDAAISESSRPPLSGTGYKEVFVFISKKEIKRK
jgi:hypothetical protein